MTTDNNKPDEMPETIYAGKNEDGYITISEKTWDDYNANCSTKYIRADLATTNQTDIAEKLASAIDEAERVLESAIVAYEKQKGG